MRALMLAQAMMEYGVMATVTAKLTGAYTEIELSLREHTGTWLLVGGGVLALGWLLRRR